MLIDYYKPQVNAGLLTVLDFVGDFESFFNHSHTRTHCDQQLHPVYFNFCISFLFVSFPWKFSQNSVRAHLKTEVCFTTVRVQGGWEWGSKGVSFS